MKGSTIPSDHCSLTIQRRGVTRAELENQWQTSLYYLIV